jgi:hypothetical protein
MAQVKITELSATTAPVGADILPIVTDTTGTPATKKVTVTNLLNSRRLYSIVPAANFSLTAGSSAQNAFPTTGDVFTLEALTTYKFEGMYFIDKSGTTCTIALSFVLAGGATITSIKYIALTQNVAKNTTGATHGSAWVDTVSATVVNATASTAAYIKIEGLIRMDAAGTVTPQITFSATPTSPVMLADSYLKFDKIGSNTENTLGSVA